MNYAFRWRQFNSASLCCRHSKSAALCYWHGIRILCFSVKTIQFCFILRPCAADIPILRPCATDIPILQFTQGLSPRNNNVAALRCWYFYQNGIIFKQQFCGFTYSNPRGILNSFTHGTEPSLSACKNYFISLSMSGPACRRMSGCKKYTIYPWDRTLPLVPVRIILFHDLNKSNLWNRAIPSKSTRSRVARGATTRPYW